MKIIIIEDDLKIREELSKLLKKNGYETILLNEFENIPLQIENIDENPEINRPEIKEINAITAIDESFETTRLFIIKKLKKNFN